MKGDYFDERFSLEVFVDLYERPPTVEVRLPSMASLPPDAARRFGLAICVAADIAEAAARQGFGDDDA